MSCSRCGASISEMCDPCTNVALLRAAMVLKQAEDQVAAEELADDFAYEMERVHISPELDEWDMRPNGLFGF